RPRRCGWFDAVAVRSAIRINGVDSLALTKPDVLEGLKEIKACFAYRYKGSRLDEFPSEPWILERVEPEYRSFPLWSGSLHRLREPEQLPSGFKDYLSWLEDVLETKVALISTGVDRQDMIYRKEELQKMLGPKAEKLF
ncbi:MAG TPA: adenylosuccinate synthase, partial [Candidatus Aminicenantes bacterium]|nr:adenylosuccinate synthase [Candidatus Aminicenantes bacterium]